MGLVPGSGIGLQERCARSSELRPVSLAMRFVRSIIEYLLRRRRRFPGPLLSGLLWWLDKPGNRDTGRGKRTGKDIGRGLRSTTYRPVRTASFASKTWTKKIASHPQPGGEGSICPMTTADVGKVGSLRSYCV